ncbi:RHS repeat protein [Chryseobacterium sp. 2VB]|uniref:RHS repeat protein n=1 Tax=Chryseobacterium sp. 2VB TaxID=2502204 RepID=UPI0010F9FFAA|nr:RHS repeat domain-containing protein [Chryseobacterium sp. 2VB]
MKKIFLLLIYMLGFTLYNGQQQSQNTEIVRPAPSVAGLSTYNRVPVSVQTGIPDISYPLINVETGNKSVNINLGISYHAANTSSRDGVSDVGKGWMILGAGVVSREILNDFDEVLDDTSYIYYHKNEFDDIYNFNIPGESGKFRFIRDTLNNTFQVVKLTPFTSKIEYQRSANQATLILDSFTITNESGIKYVFKDYDISMMHVWLYYNDPKDNPRHGDRKYRSTFYLSSILDENGQELVKYTYLRDLKYPPGVNQVASTETNKLTRIEVKGHGIIELNYDKNENENENKNQDIFSINNIILKTANNAFIKKYVFKYSYISVSNPMVNYRTLASFSQVDQNAKIIENYGFDYLGTGYEEGDEYVMLTKVKLPTGGVIRYDFEMIPYAYNGKEIQIPAPKEALADIAFTKANGVRKYAFTLTETKTVEIDATGIGDLASYSWAAQFWKKNGSSYAISHSIGVPVDPNTNFEYVQKRIFDPGEYYLDLYCNDIGCSNITFDPPAVISLSKIVGEPSIDVQWIPKSGLPRIKTIKYFNSTPDNTFNVTPATIEEYDYNRFDNQGSSSGYLVEGGSLNGLDPASPVFIYKNIKVSQGNNNGYIRYYFKAPDSYPIPSGSGIWPNFNITRGGLIDKKEVYSSSNQKLSEDIFDYTFEEYNGPSYLVAPSYTIGNFYLKTTWIKNSKVTSKNYFDTGTTETNNEVFRNSYNNKPNLERNTSFDGSIQETTYKYALDKNNQKLINANMVGFPLEITTIAKKNASDTGKLLSRAETKYDNPGNKYPSSSVSYDSQNSVASEVTFSRYDTKGNLEEYTTKDGITVSVVWGYNKTQPIAKIEGAAYSQIAPYVTDIISKSDLAVISEQDLQNSLDAFRNNANLSNYQITTYLFDSLNRMKTMTPPTGVRAVYQYDAAGRLQKVEDATGKVLKKYEYNYGH